MRSTLIVLLFTVGAASTARAAEPSEIVVTGRPRAPASTTLSNAELRSVPGAFGDPFRVVEVLPGASPLQSGTPYLIVRGAPPGNTAVLVDGIPVPLLFHLAIGPAVLPSVLVDRVDYHAGGAPARFGRAIGGVISAETRAPEPEARAYGQVRFFDAGALVESPLADGRAYALVAGRYSYTGALLSLTSPSVDLAYSDYQARAGARLDQDNELSVFAFGSHDRRGELGDFKTTFSADFHRVDLRFDRRLSGGAGLRVATTLGLDASSNEQASTTAELARLRIELDRPLDQTMRLRAGVDAAYTHFDEGKAKKRDYAFAAMLFYPEHTDVVTGAYADLVWRPLQRVEIVPGVRADFYDWNVGDNLPGYARSAEVSSFYEQGYNAPLSGKRRALGIDPRVAARFVVHPKVAVVSTVGAYHQGPSFFAPSPGLQPPGFQRGLQSSFQRSAGIEVALPKAVLATATLFSHEYRNATAFTTCAIPKGGFDLASPCVGERTHGGAIGFELLVRRSFSHRVGGFLSYTLSRATDEPAVPQSTRTGLGRRVTAFDHTHVLNAALGVQLGAGWTAGSRFFLFTGRPLGRTRLERTDTFARVDVRIEKRWRLLRDGWIAVVAEGLNVTLAREEYGTECEGGSCSPVLGSPVVIPSLGVEAQL